MSGQRVLVVADASSIINLEQVEMAGASLSRWLFREFCVEISSTVHDEVKRHGVSAAKYSRHRRHEDFDRLEQIYLGRRVELGTPEDAGERHNCCVALEALRRRRFGQCVFLCDDRRAVGKFVQETMSNYLAGSCWTSLDLVLYLYFRHCADSHNTIILTQAENALRDLVAALGRRFDESSPPPISPKLSRLLTGYIDKLSRLHQCALALAGH